MNETTFEHKYNIGDVCYYINHQFSSLDEIPAIWQCVVEKVSGVISYDEGNAIITSYYKLRAPFGELDDVVESMIFVREQDAEMFFKEEITKKIEVLMSNMRRIKVDATEYHGRV